MAPGSFYLFSSGNLPVTITSCNFFPSRANSSSSGSFQVIKMARGGRLMPLFLVCRGPDLNNPMCGNLIPSWNFQNIPVNWPVVARSSTTSFPSIAAYWLLVLKRLLWRQRTHDVHFSRSVCHWELKTPREKHNTLHVDLSLLAGREGNKEN